MLDPGLDPMYDVESYDDTLFTEHLRVRVYERMWSDGKYEYIYYLAAGHTSGPLNAMRNTYDERQDEQHIHDLIEEWSDDNPMYNFVHDCLEA